MGKLDELLDYQVHFSFTEVNQGVHTNGSEIVCETEIGDFKNLVGDFVLRSSRLYTFSFKIINALNCKLGIVERKFIEELRNNNSDLKGSFSDYPQGYSLFSPGFRRHGSSALLKGPKVCRAFCPGDVVTLVLNSSKGSLRYFLNQEFLGILFLDERLKYEEFFPAVAILGDDQRLRLTTL